MKHCADCDTPLVMPESVRCRRCNAKLQLREHRKVRLRRARVASVWAKRRRALLKRMEVLHV